MPESPDDAIHEEQPEQDTPGGEKSSEAESSSEVGPDQEPGLGGYEGRDPKTEMPRVPSSPETQDDE